MKKYILILLGIITFISCGGVKKNNSVKTNNEIKVYVLNGGEINANKLEIFSSRGLYKGEAKKFSNPIFVIKHPKGNVVWDCGLTEQLVGQKEFTTPDGAFTVSRKDSLVNQLNNIGLKPSDIKYLILSHTHFDHIGSSYVLKESEWIVQKNELSFVKSEELKKVAPENYEYIKMLENIKEIEGDYDIFGDSTIIIKSFPGHTPGHQSLFIKLKKSQNLLLTGDMYHFIENRQNKGVPSFNTNKEQTLKSMELFEEFAKQNNAKIIIQHEKTHFEGLPKPPKFLN